ncbi:hypothetical protein JXR74_03645 [Candidatus Mcinerneyibacteriota bacterium]|nr:hypothetical protein [Candidatus Mcinerneyibacteriota bacterium]
MKKELVILVFLLAASLTALHAEASLLTGVTYGYDENIYRDSSQISSAFLEESLFATYSSSAFLAEAFVSHMGFTSEASENQLLMNLSLSYDLLLSMQSTLRLLGEWGLSDYTEWEKADLTGLKGSFSYIYDDLSRIRTTLRASLGSSKYGLETASNSFFEGSASFQYYYALDDSLTLSGYFRHHIWEERRLETGHAGTLLTPSSDLFGLSLSTELSLRTAFTLTPRLYWESQNSNMAAIIPAEIEPLVEQDADTYHCYGILIEASLSLGRLYLNPAVNYFYKEYPERYSFLDEITPSDAGVTIKGWNISAEGRFFLAPFLATSFSWEWDDYESEDYWSRGSGYSASAGLFLLF